MTQTPPISAEQVEAAARIISPNCLWSAGYVNQHVERRRNNARAKAIAALTAAASIPASRGVGTPEQSVFEAYATDPEAGRSSYLYDHFKRGLVGIMEPDKKAELAHAAWRAGKHRAMLAASPAPQPVQEQEPSNHIALAQWLESTVEEHAADCRLCISQGILPTPEAYGDDQSVPVGRLTAAANAIRELTGRLASMVQVADGDETEILELKSEVARLEAIRLANYDAMQIMGAKIENGEASVAATARAEAAEAKVERLTKALRKAHQLAADARDRRSSMVEMPPADIIDLVEATRPLPQTSEPSGGQKP